MRYDNIIQIEVIDERWIRRSSTELSAKIMDAVARHMMPSDPDAGQCVANLLYALLWLGSPTIPPIFLFLKCVLREIQQTEVTARYYLKQLNCYWRWPLILWCLVMPTFNSLCSMTCSLLRMFKCSTGIYKMKMVKSSFDGVLPWQGTAIHRSGLACLQLDSPSPLFLLFRIWHFQLSVRLTLFG